MAGHKAIGLRKAHHKSPRHSFPVSVRTVAPVAPAKNVAVAWARHIDGNQWQSIGEKFELTSFGKLA